jgi:uncharacterized membrane protein
MRWRLYIDFGHKPCASDFTQTGMKNSKVWLKLMLQLAAGRLIIYLRFINIYSTGISYVHLLDAFRRKAMILAAIRKGLTELYEHTSEIFG